MIDVPEQKAGRDAALAALLAEIQASPRTHDFFAVLRRIESLHPEWPQWGRAARPSQEALRFSQDVELDFAPSALSSLDLDAPAAPRLGVRFFGLFGSQGPLPLHLTEYARERLRAHGDPTLARFLDVFHHRLLTFFYRAWGQGQPTVHLDRPDGDRFSTWLGSGFGFDRSQTGHGVLPESALLFQAGLMGTRSRHAEGLRKILSQYFRVRVAIDENVAQWLVLDTEDRSRLGYALNRSERLRAPRSELGLSATGGDRVHDRQFKFRIVLGPLTLERYLAFLPDGSAWPALRRWVDQYAGIDLRWDVELVLAAPEVPPPVLGRHLRLGQTTWIGRRPVPRDRSDLRLRPATASTLRPETTHA